MNVYIYADTPTVTENYTIARYTNDDTSGASVYKFVSIYKAGYKPIEITIEGSGDFAMSSTSGGNAYAGFYTGIYPEQNKSASNRYGINGNDGIEQPTNLASEWMIQNGTETKIRTFPDSDFNKWGNNPFKYTITTEGVTRVVNGVTTQWTHNSTVKSFLESLFEGNAVYVGTGVIRSSINADITVVYEGL